MLSFGDKELKLRQNPLTVTICYDLLGSEEGVNVLPDESGTFASLPPTPPPPPAVRRIEANLRFPGRDAPTIATCQHLSLTIDIKKKTELPQTLTDCRGLITGSERQNLSVSAEKQILQPSLKSQQNYLLTAKCPIMYLSRSPLPCLDRVMGS